MIVKPDLYDDSRVGQLGNKMFILAAMIGWSLRNDKPISIDWQYCDAFPNTTKYNTKEKIIHFNYSEPHFNYSPIPLQTVDNNLYVAGYFQSEKHFEHCKDEIRKAFTFSEQIQNKAKHIVNRNSAERICSLHIRRTDYLDSAQRISFHGSCSVDYYKRAIDLLKPDRCLVFSDDIEWCKQTFGDKFSYAENNSNVEDMCAMSMCDDHVVANSSFSWWGSWLNAKEDKRIVAPISWFGVNGPKPHDDIYTKDMIRIKE